MGASQHKALFSSAAPATLRAALDPRPPTAGPRLDALAPAPPDAAFKRRTADELVHLNVGGKYFTTRLSTLLHYPNSALAKMVDPNSAFGAPVTAGDERIFFDRNGKYFGYVLDHLRGLELPEQLPEYILSSIRAESLYYGLDELTLQIDTLAIYAPLRHALRRGDFVEGDAEHRYALAKISHHLSSEGFVEAAARALDYVASHSEHGDAAHYATASLSCLSKAERGLNLYLAAMCASETLEKLLYFEAASTYAEQIPRIDVAGAKDALINEHDMRSLRALQLAATMQVETQELMLCRGIELLCFANDREALVAFVASNAASDVAMYGEPKSHATGQMQALSKLGQHIALTRLGRYDEAMLLYGHGGALLGPQQPALLRVGRAHLLRLQGNRPHPARAPGGRGEQDAW